MEEGFVVTLAAGSYMAFVEAVGYDLDENRKRHPVYTAGRESGSTYTTTMAFDTQVKVDRFLDWLANYNDWRKGRSSRPPVRVISVLAPAIAAGHQRRVAMLNKYFTWYDNQSDPTGSPYWEGAGWHEGTPKEAAEAAKKDGCAWTSVCVTQTTSHPTSGTILARA